jgi:predicted AlkP superfamily phosphohydrolase/phosphomutase
MALPRTLVIGVDGATWDLVTPAVERGWMPRFGRFLAGSRRGILRSVDPPVTIPAWHSLVTGLSPAAMNRWGFTSPTSRPGGLSLVTTYRPFEAIWDTLGRQGWKVGVLNFPTVPAPPVHGFFVGGMLPARGASTTYPLSLGRRLEREFGGWLYDLPARGLHPVGPWLELAARAIDQKALAAETLITEYSPDFLFVLFSETDRVQHDLFDQLASAPPELAADLASYWGALDAALHRVMLAFHGTKGPGYTWVCSDHGFGPSRGYFFTNRFLERRGFLVLERPAPARIRPVVTDLVARVDRHLPLSGAVVRLDRWRARLTQREGKDGDSLDQTFGWYSRFVDWERTKAFSAPTPEAVFANFYRGEPTEPERHELKRELLREFDRFPAASIRAIDPEREYGRPLPAEAPLLLISINDHSWETRGDLNHYQEHLARRPSYFQRQGTHRHDGILALQGPGIPAGVLPAPIPLLAIAPTMHQLLGLGVSPRHDGGASPDLLSQVAVPWPETRREGGDA